MKTMRTFRNTVDLDTFSAKDVDLLDIAHGLSLLCRYNGACPTFYCVGDHAIRVADRVWEKTHDPLTTLLALHHDDTEPYIGDQIRPIKDDLYIMLLGGIVPFSVYEDQLLDVILDALLPLKGLRTHSAKWAVVKQADDEILQEEMFRMWGTPVPGRDARMFPRLYPRTSSEAERDFLFAHQKLLMQISPSKPLALGEFR